MLDELIRAIGPDHVVSPVPAEYLTDATARGLHGSALAVVRPADAVEAARVVAVCYRNDIALTPRGGGAGLVVGEPAAHAAHAGPAGCGVRPAAQHHDLAVPQALQVIEREGDAGA